MKTRTAAALLACTLAACSAAAASPVAPSAPVAPPAAAGPETTSELPAAPPAIAGLQPLEPPSVDISPPLSFDLPRLPSSWFERPSFPAAGHRPAYTGLRIVTDAGYPGRIDQHRSQKLRAVITRRDGVSATSGADWRTGNTHVATVDRHGRVTARNPGRFDTIATARGLEARMTGMVVHPAPGRQYDDRFWRELIYDAQRDPPAEWTWIWVLDDPSPDFYLWLGDPTGRRVAADSWLGWARRNLPHAVEAVTGERYRGRIHAGLSDLRQEGTITIVFDTPPHESPRGPNTCGRAHIGAPVGRVWMYLDSSLRPYSTCGGEWQLSTFIHEIGHAMGLYHVSYGRGVMCVRDGGARAESCRAGRQFAPAEQYHARLAYRIGRGWREYCGWPLRVACGDLPRRGAAPRMLTLP